jgi:nickel transport protein
MLAVVLAMVVSVVPGGQLWAHGMTLVLEQRGDVVVATVRYAGGTPVVGADVVIRAPGDAAYQSGTTDAAGLFAFVPAHPGEWQVLVDDGMGHRRTARLAFETAAAPAQDNGDAGAGEATVGGTISGAPAETMPWRLATGLSLLLGLTGFGYGVAARRRNGAGGL